MTALTARQEAVLNLREKGQSDAQIALALGISRRTVREHRAKAEEIVNRDPAVDEAMNSFGLLQEPDTVWFKSKNLSVQYRRPKGQGDGPAYLDQVREAFSDLPPAPRIEGPTETLDDMMVVYPLFDVHHGLRAHAEVSGEEMDATISKRRITGALSSIMSMAPDATRAVIVNGGDFTHQTDDTNATRRSGHILDVAGRNGPTVREAIEILSACIEMALTKHDTVEYYSVPGNHDPQNWETIQIALLERYRNHERVMIDERWTEFSVIEHGEVALFIHHGDKRTPKDLGMMVAAEFPEVWGRTRYRTLMTGHLHHLKHDEFPGIYWMQMPAITVRDHHASGGYRSHSLIMAIGYDHESEATRNTMRLS